MTNKIVVTPYGVARILGEALDIDGTPAWYVILRQRDNAETWTRPASYAFEVVRKERCEDDRSLLTK